VDFLVDMQEGRSLLDLVGLQQDFEQFLGQPIDVLTERGLNRYLKDRILTEARPL
jgi:predicted nucleotidyltransferase